MAASYKESFLILTSLFEGVNPGYELYFIRSRLRIEASVWRCLDTRTAAIRTRSGQRQQRGVSRSGGHRYSNSHIRRREVAYTGGAIITGQEARIARCRRCPQAANWKFGQP